MIPALYILGFTALVGLILYIGELGWRRRHQSGATNANSTDTSEAGDFLETGADLNNPEEGQTADDSQCCGLHLVCEKDSLSPMSEEILYYDDEELDRFIGRAADSYSPDEEEEFREVLMTLRPEDVSGWARSITQRRLELPPDVRDELLILVNEQRNSR